MTTKFSMYRSCARSLAAVLVATLAGEVAPRSADDSREGLGVLDGVFPTGDDAAYFVACAQTLQSDKFLTYSPATRRRLVAVDCVPFASLTLERMAREAGMPVPAITETLAVKTVLAHYSRDFRAEFDAWTAARVAQQAEADQLLRQYQMAA
jgi:hypothetical protein